MVDIPPDVAASSAQAGFTAREVAAERDARRTGRAEAARRQIQSLDEASATVDTNDGDTAVFTDAEGTGSQGRATEDDEPSPDDHEQDATAESGVVKGDDGRPHLDIQA